MLKSETFEVIGEQQIYCESCENRVERLLRALQGVEQVRAQSKTQRIDVLFDVAVLESTEIAERLETAGFRTRLATPTIDR